MMSPVPTPQQAIQYQHWQIWMGRNDTGSKTIIRPLLGGLQVQQTRVPILHPFTSFRFAIRTQRTDSAFTANWIAILFKNNVAAGYANNVSWGAAGVITESQSEWKDVTGVNRNPVSFDRGDNWYVEITGTAVSDPRVSCGFDCFGRAQSSFGGGTF